MPDGYDYDGTKLAAVTSGVNVVPRDRGEGSFDIPYMISKATQNVLDCTFGPGYQQVVKGLSEQERTSLMGVERERKKSFRGLWHLDHIVEGDQLAKEGFYYLGVCDEVYCAFCGGILRNWKAGDIPAQAHKEYFGFCKFVQRKPCYNIPYDSGDLYKDSLQKVSDEALTKGDETKKRSTEPVNPTPTGYLDMALLIKKNAEDMTWEENLLLVDAMTCHLCCKEEVGAAILPCGHFCICQSCSKTNLPRTCPYCACQVKGACCAYMC